MGSVQGAERTAAAGALKRSSLLTDRIVGINPLAVVSTSESAGAELHGFKDPLQHDDGGGAEAGDHLRVQGPGADRRGLRELRRRDRAGNQPRRQKNHLLTTNDLSLPPSITPTCTHIKKKKTGKSRLILV